VKKVDICPICLSETYSREKIEKHKRISATQKQLARSDFEALANGNY
jgi:hypothetical protein